MSYFNRHPNQFRFLFGIFLLYLVVLAAANFYYTSSTPTDENLFTNPPSEFYIMKKFPAALLRGNNKAGEFVQVGDLLVSIGQRSLASG
ncbi:MAG: hypothetical protein HY089_00440, partial [Ignavibacteriales bacterium]|nr:hypothetical protein [Ignavibacteriales bacterium]